MVGIYSIVSKQTGRLYIGQSTNFPNRKKEHLKKLLDNKHENIHLQRTYNKYGVDDFSWCFEECSISSLTTREQYFIDSVDEKDLFNINLNASRPPVRKKGTMSLEERKAISERIIKQNTGCKLSAEHKAKISKKLKGSKMPESQVLATTNRMRIMQYAKNPIVRRKMADAKKKLSNEQCIEIAVKYSGGKISQDKLAKEYNCNRRQIRTALSYYNNYLK